MNNERAIQNIARAEDMLKELERAIKFHSLVGAKAVGKLGPPMINLAEFDRTYGEWQAFYDAALDAVRMAKAALADEAS